MQAASRHLFAFLVIPERKLEHTCPRLTGQICETQPANGHFSFSERQLPLCDTNAHVSICAPIFFPGANRSFRGAAYISECNRHFGLSFNQMEF